MSIKNRLTEDAKQALKAGDKTRVACLRMLRAKILEREVALRPKKGTTYELDDDEALQVLTSYAKQRQESIDSYHQGGREDLVAREQAELEIVRHYLPEPLSDERIRHIVAESVAELGATSPREMGAVIKRVMARTRGAADGRLVSRLVREALEDGGTP
ncbi:MAG TPA: GatB/YqeY domain-containing protein [Candidatus Polarisedimenticolaceae bacterium]|nr:GatB/YqeY domain-containing protein [Candidatus Polarisedimenticolaceae bacterium]